MYSINVSTHGMLPQQIARSDLSVMPDPISGQPTASRYGFYTPEIHSDAYLTIMNTDASEKLVEIQSLRWAPDYTVLTSSSEPPLLRFCVPGSIVQGTRANIVAMDTDNTAFPSDIFIGSATGPDVASLPMLRNIVFGRAVRNSDVSIGVSAGVLSVLSSSQCWRSMVGGQRLTIRAGERIGVTIANTNISTVTSFPVYVHGTVTIGGETYSFQVLASVQKSFSAFTPNNMIFGIENNTASTVMLLDSLNFSFPAFAQTSTIGTLSQPILTAEPIVGAYGGNLVSPIALDSANAAFPSGIEIRSEAVAIQYAPDRNPSPGWCGPDILRRWRTTRTVRTAAGASNVGGTMLGPNEVPLLPDGAGFRVTLREGQGIAVFHKNDFFERIAGQQTVNHMWHPFHIEGMLKITDNPAPPSGGGEFTSISF